MKRPSRSSGPSGKAGRRKASKLLRGRTSAEPSHRARPAADEAGKIARLASELKEAREQQAATAGVLHMISCFPTDVQSVLEAIIRVAADLCKAEYALLFRLRDGKYRVACSNNAAAEYVKYFDKNPISLNKRSLIGRTVLARHAVHIEDCLADQEYKLRVAARLGRHRTMLGIPLLHEGEVVGAIGLLRTVVRPFTEKQIELVTAFADQAVIAIENARLLNELRARTSDLSQRTTDLTEALEQQTATSDVLTVISSSPTDLQPVFDAMLANATRLCEASFGTLWLCENDDQMRIAALHGRLPRAFQRKWSVGTVHRPSPSVPTARAFGTRKPVQITDLKQDRAYTDRDPLAVASVEGGGIRSLIAVPLLKDGTRAIGAITIYRQEVRPFTEKQIGLVANFAAQAVIAIENARLLNELRQRTTDLGEALEQQTGTAEVLKIINSSAGELDPVFDVMLTNAIRICGASLGTMALYENGGFRHVKLHGAPPAFVDAITQVPLLIPKPGQPLDEMVKTKRIVHTPDYLMLPPESQGRLATIAGARTLLCVPMLKDEELVGTIGVYRREVKPFTDGQIALIQNFADQAVIAIENARLLGELRQRTDDLSKSLNDLRSAQDRLVQTQKLASLGQLTAGIAHEIKNPLNFVNNFSGVSVELIDELKEALQHVQADDRTLSEIGELGNILRDNLQKIVQHGKRADSIVKNMLLHSREGSGEHRPVDINSLVDEAVNLAYHGARAEKQGFNITLERSFDPAAGDADVFPQEITRVLLNLISNGFYAASQRKARANGDGYEPTLAVATKNLGGQVEIRIRDNGTGMPPEIRDKVFNPFFTTKPAGEGTGLGLSLSHDIVVKQHSGSIEVDTQPGEFTEFKIVLPRAAATTNKSGGGHEPAYPGGRRRA